MDMEHAKQMMDAFYIAKRIRDQMPPLPEGVHPSDINIVDAVIQLSAGGAPVRISDVADFRHLPRPGVTRTVKEMETKGLLRKEPDASDRRVIHLVLTDRGQALYQTYVQDYFGDLIRQLHDVSDEEIEAMTSTIFRVEEKLHR